MNSHGSNACCWVELCRLDQLPSDDVTMPALGPNELERLARISAPLRRRQYLGGHWLARRMASEHRGGLPDAWEWQTDSRGQPTLRRGDRFLCVSISHSSDWLACAVADVAVGIDVELNSRQRDWQRLAQYSFPPQLDAGIQLLSPEMQAEHFLSRWCLHEARGKRCGDGVLVSVLRSVVPVPSEMALAEAMLWSLPQGHLALAVDAGTTLSLRGVSGQASGWRFRAAP